MDQTQERRYLKDIHNIALTLQNIDHILGKMLSGKSDEQNVDSVIKEQKDGEEG